MYNKNSYSFFSNSLKLIIWLFSIHIESLNMLVIRTPPPTPRKYQNLLLYVRLINIIFRYKMLG